ncbi:DNA cytosine methyltransferase [Cyanobacterium aponinum FACHB-4101]|uniref:DNA cytosine methyltransferase n=1 Tax=Cyanobacterium aponinum TaxID=379064 RepID=UPI001680CAB2|nr:DNA cytosine methyltransferase [Cyanobacterium aponinum]MBD2394628.1 DNA cytosine methyltransferase [Cyanobacterium aponinum FACHB-4101]
MKCIDLFAGCGGMSLGFSLAGFEIVGAFENWDCAIDVYRENFSHPIFKQDLKNEQEVVEKIKELKPEIIIGGPPCQDFSSAGKRDLTLGRADLTYTFANIVCSIKPNWFVMENVEQIKKSYILRDVIEQFISKNYGISAVILDASYCGVPQARTRFFLIGHLGDKHNQLNSIFQEMLSDKPMTMRDYLGNSLDIQYYYRHPRNYNRRAIFSIDEPSPTIRGVNRPIPKGYKLNSCDPPNIDLKSIRPLTTIERSYIQTFPKDFKFRGSKTNLEQMIGNAVPVNLAKFVAEGIKTYLKTGSQRQLSLLDLIDLTQKIKYDFTLPKRSLKNV